MKFEEILRSKLKEVMAQVYPIVAPEGVKSPFIVFKQRNLKYVKTLDGYTKFAEGYYDIALISNTYDGLASNKENIKDKILELIGYKDVIHIQDISIEFNGDNYVYEVNGYQSNISLEIKYEEGEINGI